MSRTDFHFMICLQQMNLSHHPTIHGRVLTILYRVACRQANLEQTDFKLETKHFRVPGKWVQDSLF
jgi:hypothetical protein